MSSQVVFLQTSPETVPIQINQQFSVVKKITDQRFSLSYRDLSLQLTDHQQPKLTPLFVDFAGGKHQHRRKFGGGKSQPIAKAVGLNKKRDLHILDATAGLGSDSFVMASIGAQVTMCEQHPVVQCLLEDGLQRGLIHHDIMSICQRMQLVKLSAQTYLQQEKTEFDVIYLDPMFPVRQKTAAVKKEMAIFHHLVGEDHNDGLLLQLALQYARFRVVVKRPKAAGFFADQSPSLSLEGKSGRFDIYTNQKIS